MRFPPVKLVKVAGFLAFALVVLGGLAIALGAVPAPWEAHAEEPTQEPPKPALGVELVKGLPHTLAVPTDVRIALGIRRGNAERVHVVRRPTKTQPLVLPGSTALDPARLLRIRARFAPAELVQIGKVHDSSLSKGSPYRELRTGDKVRKGDILGVFYSDVVGNKK